jgi:magnesium-transporting ATPase (P-type)
VQSQNLYYSNVVKSTRYNLISFVPATLFLQFTKVINCFYLVNMILQMFPQISTNAWYFTAFPLAFIIGLGMIKEAIADLKRYLQDRQVNNYPVKKVTGPPPPKAGSKVPQFKQITTGSVQVGDIIVVKDDETVPADCILLSTDPTRDSTLGQCFISTGNLDGERNVKPKLAY